MPRERARVKEKRDKRGCGPSGLWLGEKAKPDKIAADLLHYLFGLIEIRLGLVN